MQNFFSATASIAAMIHNWNVSAGAKANNAKILILITALCQLIHFKYVHFLLPRCQRELVSSRSFSNAEFWFGQ
jgi:hypothetical protein